MSDPDKCPWCNAPGQRETCGHGDSVMRYECSSSCHGDFYQSSICKELCNLRLFTRKLRTLIAEMVR